ncbi:MAG: GNAT family N-acetyltransferase [Chloroflexota bacterium]
MSQVELREITKETVRDILRLKVKPEQENFVAPNAVSLSEALFEEKAWYRAIYANGEPVGFLMLFDNDENAEYYLWRFMIAAPYQGFGYGAEAVKLLIDYVKTRPNAKKLELSYVPAKGGPESFYLKQGFKNTGRVEHGENVMELIFEE